MWTVQYFIQSSIQKTGMTQLLSQIDKYSFKTSQRSFTGTQKKTNPQSNLSKMRNVTCIVNQLSFAKLASQERCPRFSKCVCLLHARMPKTGEVGSFLLPGSSSFGERLEAFGTFCVIPFFRWFIFYHFGLFRFLWRVNKYVKSFRNSLKSFLRRHPRNRHIRGSRINGWFFGL